MRHTIPQQRADHTVLERKTAPSSPDKEAADDEPADDDTLNELQKRAKELEAPDPVLKITETPGEEE